MFQDFQYLPFKRFFNFFRNFKQSIRIQRKITQKLYILTDI